MEKEVYLTEAPFINEINETSLPFKEKSSNAQLQSRAETSKITNKRMLERYPPQIYYDDKKIKPGLCLYKTILQIEEKRANGEYKGPYLKMSIPQTVLLNDNSNSLIYQENEYTKVEPFATNQSFVRRVRRNDYEGNIYPLVIHSGISGINFNNTIMMNTEILANKIIPRSEGFICRKFIRPYGNVPNILRLFYIAKSSRQLKKNYGFKVINNRAMDQELFKKKHRLIHNYIVNTQREECYSATLIKGKALAKCEQAADSLLEYLQKATNIKISELVIDFVIDEEKKIWFHQLKAIKSKEVTRLWDIGNEQELELMAQQNNNSLMCKLCGMMYSRHELEKIVTNKLIWELVCHLSSRGTPLKGVPHLKKEGLSYVCDICYDVIVAQHKLINVQKQYSNLLNVCPNTIDRVIPLEKKPKNNLLFLNEEEFSTEGAQTLKAWRLFFYIEKIKNYERKDDKKQTYINLEFKFKNFKEKFTKVIQHEELKTSKSRYSSMRRIASAKLEKRSFLSDKLNQSNFTQNTSKSKIHDSTTQASKISTSLVRHEPFCQNYSLQKAKIYVLYTKKHQSSNLLSNTNMEFTLTINEQKFVGTSSTLQQLKNKDTCQRHSSQIFLFDEKLKYCNLELTVGLICDGETSNQNLQLDQIDGVYYPSKVFSNCQPLPEEWMEVFTQGEELPNYLKELTYDQIKKIEVVRESRIKEKLQALPTITFF